MRSLGLVALAILFGCSQEVETDHGTAKKLTPVPVEESCTRVSVTALPVDNDQLLATMSRKAGRAISISDIESVCIFGDKFLVSVRVENLLPGTGGTLFAVTKQGDIELLPSE